MVALTSPLSDTVKVDTLFAFKHCKPVVPVVTSLAQATVPVKVGDAVDAFKAKLVSISVFVYVVALSAFKSRAVWVAVETGLLASAVLSTYSNPTMVFVTPDTVPVNVGFASGAFDANWVVTVVA